MESSHCAGDQAEPPHKDSAEVDPIAFHTCLNIHLEGGRGV